jgi:hypothetical protein
LFRDGRGGSVKNVDGKDLAWDEEYKPVMEFARKMRQTKLPKDPTEAQG